MVGVKMASKIRKQRSNALYMKLKSLMRCEYMGNYEKLKIIFPSILNNVTTTQLNQINIALKINEENYHNECLELLNEA
jgi:hypothetical protein